MNHALNTAKRSASKLLPARKAKATRLIFIKEFIAVRRHKPYRIKQLGTYLGRSVQSIRKDVRERRLPATRIGGQIKFDKRDIDQLLEARKIVSVEQLIDEANPTTDEFSQGG